MHRRPPPPAAPSRARLPRSPCRSRGRAPSVAAARRAPYVLRSATALILRLRIWRSGNNSPCSATRSKRPRFGPLDRAFWTWKSRSARTGRPSIGSAIAHLVRTMALANPLWGAPRIHGELLKLGLDVSQRTVGRLMPRRAKPPSQTWRTFLENHVADLVSVHCFVVPTATFRVLHVFVVLLTHRRRVVHFNVTDSATAAWTAQQIVEAFPNDSATRYLLRDRDSIYGGEFRRRVKGMCIAEVLSSPRSPWRNPFAERVIGT